jgi:quercetin dioxygenase-like cupin family protein
MKNSYRMLMGVLLTTLAFLVAAGEAPAQDVVKVSPETHKVLVENDQVRVLDVIAKPGEKVAMHSHPASVLYYLTDGKLKVTYPNGKTEEREVKAGTAVWSGAVTHAVENVGSKEFHEVHTELKETAQKPARSKRSTM